MKAFYLICFLLSFSLFLWQSVSDARQSVVQRTALLIVIISNGGYLALAGASNLAEAVLATKISMWQRVFSPIERFPSSRMMPEHILTRSLPKYFCGANRN